MTRHSVEIVSFRWKNFRDFEDLVVDLAPVDKNGVRAPKKNALIQIQNGYGKTSTMWAIRSALSRVKLGDFGENKISAEATRASYRYRYPSSYGWGGDPSKQIEFEMALKIDGDLIRHGFTIDPVTGEQKFWTSNSKEGGIKDDYNLPGWFRDMFGSNSELLSLYVFDGELAGKLVDGAGASNLWTALQKISGIHTVSRLIAPNGQLMQVLDEAKQEGGSKNKDRSLETLEINVNARIRALKNELNLLNIEKQEVEEQRASDEKTLKALVKELGDSSPILKETKKRLDSAKEVWQSELTTITRVSLNPDRLLNFEHWNGVAEFYEQQHRAKLPKGVAKNFFDDILLDEGCICGSDWTDDMREHLEEHREHYLVAGLMTRVMTIQTNVRDITHRGDAVPASLLKESLLQARQDLDEAEKAYNNALADHDETKQKQVLELTQKSVQSQVDLDSLKKKIEKITSDQRNTILRDELDKPIKNKKDGGYKFTGKGYEDVQNIYCLEEYVKAIKLRLGMATKHASEFRGAGRVDRVLKEALRELEMRQQKRIEEGMNEFTRDWPGFRNKIAFKDNKIEFYDFEGNLQTDINESAKLAALYGLVSSLNSYSSVDFPIVIDTPFAGFGQGMVNEWAETVPRAFSQTILLINGLEKQGLRGTWICESKPHPTCSYYTLRRTNENLKTGKDKSDSPKIPDQQLKTSGKMIVSTIYKDFLNYESAVKREVVK